MKKRNRRGEILVENVIFIVLNLIFLAILILFLVKQGSGAVLMEQTYSKQIALLIDSSKPGTTFNLNMYDAYKVAENNKFDFSKSVYISGNRVYVKLSEKGGTSYSFFNNVDVNTYLTTMDGEEGVYVFKITVKKNV